MFRVEAHGVEEEHGDDVRGGKAGGGMSGAGARGHAERMDAQQAGFFAQGFQIRGDEGGIWHGVHSFPQYRGGGRRTAFYRSGGANPIRISGEVAALSLLFSCASSGS